MSKKLVVGGVILGGVALIGFGIYKYFTKQVDLLKQFEYKVINFQINTLDPNLVKGTLTFRFTSISDLEFIINKFYMDFFFNGKNIGYIEDSVLENKPNIIPANGYSDITFDFTLNPQLVITNIADIIAFATSKKDGVIGLAGFVDVKSGFLSATVPINCTCNIKDFSCSC
jgi:hypothetical protein